MEEIITKDSSRDTIEEIITKDSNRDTMEEIITKDSNRDTMEEIITIENFVTKEFLGSLWRNMNIFNEIKVIKVK